MEAMGQQRVVGTALGDLCVGSRETTHVQGWTSKAVCASTQNSSCGDI